MKKFKHVLLHLFFTFSIIFAATWGYIYKSESLQNLGSRFIDILFQIRGKMPASENVVIVDIDEKSLKAMGQWPWQRDKVAQILYNLTNAGTGIIGFDIVFAEPDNSSPAKVLKELGIESENAPDYDTALAEAIASTPTITGYVFNFLEKLDEQRLPQIPAIFIERNKPEANYLPSPKGIVLNTPVLQSNCYSSAFFNTFPDNDGIVRNVPLVAKFQESIFSSLSLEMIRIALQARKVTLNYSEVGLESIQMKDLTIPTDRHGRLFVNYRGPQRSFQYISAKDVFENSFNPKDVEGKFILIGTSAAGLLDLRATPFDSAYPGVEVHANAIDNMLNSDFLSRPAWVESLDLLIIIGSGLLLSIALITLPPLYAGLVAMGLYGVFYYFVSYMFIQEGIIVNVVFPLITMTLIFLVSLILNYFLEAKQKEIIKSKFASKVSPAVMEDLLKNSDGNVFSAHEREITVFFSDVRNFTNISEAMGNPKSLIDLMNTYMDPMTDIIIKTGGTIDKFIGDAIMAYWNAPADVENHADKAVVATLEQLKRLKSLNEEIRKNPEFKNVVDMADRLKLPIIDIGIGLNTGVAIVGEMGSTGRSDYTVIGDAINLGARLESLCKYYNSKLNISNFTKEQLKGEYIFRFLDLVTVKGKSEPIEIWQIIDFDEEKNDLSLYEVSKQRLEDELETYHHAIQLYKEAKFQEALDIFKDLQSREDKTNKNIYAMYIERCEHYVEEPPVDFNGVFVHTTKG